MSKVYILFNNDLSHTSKSHGRKEELIGVVTSKVALDNWIKNDPVDSSKMRSHYEFELDDPELLNRIAKESEKK